MAEKKLNVEISAQDKASKVFKDFGTNVGKVGDKISDVGKSLSTKLTLPLVGVGGLAAKSFMDFETRMSNISTLISGDSTQAVKGFQDGIKELLKTIPKNADDLGASAYDIVSAGISDTATALSVLKSAGKLAVAGLGETQEATDILTSSINAFKLDAKDSDKISDILFKTVKAGKTTVSQLAQSFGASAPIVAAAGISLEEFSAATAALTTTGQPASQAQMSLRQSVVALNKPTKEMSELLKKAGYETGEAALKQDGLVKVMSKVKGAAKGNSEMLAKAWGSVEALGSATALTGQVSDSFTDTLNGMKDGSGAVSEAFNKQTKTSKAQYELLKNNLNIAMIDLGTSIMPSLQKAAEYLTEKISNLTSWWDNLSQGQKDFILKTALVIAAVGPVVTIIGQLATGISGVTTALKFLIANPLVGVITAIGLVGVAVATAIGFFGNKKESIDSVKDAYDRLKDSQKKYEDATLEVAQKELDVIQAKKDVKQKQDELNEAIRKFGPNSEQAREAHLKLQLSEGKSKEAIEALTQAKKDQDKYLNDTQAIQKQIDKSRELAKYAGEAGKALEDAKKGKEGGLANFVYASGTGQAIPKGLKGFASGTDYAPGGMALVGEQGPEIVNLPRGSQVIPNDQLKGSQTISVNIYGNISTANGQQDISNLARMIGDMLIRAEAGI